MGTTKPISNVPLILGIIGGVLGFPAALCSGMCAAGLSGAAGEAADSAANTGTNFMWLGLAAAVLGLLSAFLYKKNPKLWGAIMLIGGLLSLVTLVTFNLLSLVVAVLLLIGGIISLTQKKAVA